MKAQNEHSARLFELSWHGVLIIKSH